MSWNLTKKYLFGRNRVWPKLSHMLSLVGIVIGVVALLIVSSVMNGLRDDMMQRIIRTKAEIRVYHQTMQAFELNPELEQTITGNEEVIAVSPVVRNELLMQKDDNVTVIRAYGIDLEKHGKISELEDQIRLGSYDSQQLEDEGIIIGLDLSLALGATVGEYVRLSSPVKTEPTPLGLLPKTKNLRVIGIFSSGMPEYDRHYSYFSLNTGRYFSGYEQEIDLLQVKITDPYRSRRIASMIRNRIGDEYIVEDWSVFDKSLFEAMDLEKTVMLTVLTLMLIISGFNMACSSVRMVSEKYADIGILKALGMKTKAINHSFIMVNVLIGLTGIIGGTVISTAFIFIQSRFKIVQIPIPGFPMQWLPVVYNRQDFILVGFLVIVITLLATVIPLQKIKGMEPIKVIRNQ